MFQPDRFTQQACIAALRYRAVRNRVLNSYIFSTTYARPTEIGLDVSLLSRVSLYAVRMLFRDALIALGGSLSVFLFIPMLFGNQLTVLSAFNFVLAVLTFLLISSLLYARWRKKVESELVPLFWGEQLNRKDLLKKFPDSLSPYMEDDETKDKNITVHCCSRQFVGFGTEISDWKVIIDKTKTSNNLTSRATPNDFNVDQLYAHISESVAKNTTLPLNIELHYFIDGQAAISVKNISPSASGRAPNNITQEMAEEWRNASLRAPGKCYLMCSAFSGDGELIVTAAIRLGIIGKMLVIESHRLILPPIHYKWKQVKLCQRSPSYDLQDYLPASIFQGPFAHTLALIDGLDPIRFFSLRNEASIWISHSDNGSRLPYYIVATMDDIKIFFRYKAWMIANNTANRLCDPDFGCYLSLREALSADGLTSYSMREDAIMIFSLLDRAILDSVRSFLIERHISTEDLEETRQTIINSGIFIGEGNFNASSVSMGDKSKSTTMYNSSGAGRNGSKRRRIKKGE